ncbi:MAG: tetratricopeptide repeat protein [Bacteroidaceae bacterium]|nr:tetratricopeptide repeat protein [Bacteroidaceae bacterium]
MKGTQQRIDENTFSQLAGHVENELANGHLSVALSILSNILTMLPDIPGRNKAQEDVETTTANYKRLLQYMAEGKEDPQRHSIHTNLTHKVFRILQDLRRTYQVSTQQTIYTSTIVLLEHGIEEVSLEHLLQNAPTTTDYDWQDQLFDTIWTSPQLTSTEEQELNLFLYSAPSIVQCYVMSALTLALLHFFDPAKFRILIAHINASKTEVSVRAMVGICIISQVRLNQLLLFPQLADEVVSIFQVPERLAELEIIQHFIYLYQEAERFQQRMEKEILPTLIKVSQQRKKLGFDEMEIDLTDPEATPNITQKTRRMLNDSMQEMVHLFHEGMDVNLQTFTSLKRFSFFHKVGHWLVPYDKSRPEAAGNDIINHLPLCDSDKYSVIHLFKNLSASHLEELKQNMEQHAEFFATHNIDMDNEYKNVIQCLYRLLKRSSWTALWPDVFAPNTLFIHNPLFHKLIASSPSYLLRTGNSLLRHKNWDAAEMHLSQYAQLEGADYTLLAQIGLCMQQQQKYPSAIRNYQQSLMLKPDNPPVTYRLQYCYAQMGRYQEQLDCLLQLEEKTPEDPRILTELGLCLIQLEKWEDAEKRFYKLEFKGKRIVPSIRSIAWCCMNRGEYETAKNMYLRIFNERPAEATWEDYLNIGHTVWLQGDIAAAIVFYTEYAQRYLATNPEAKDALQPYTEDQELLLSKGKAQEDINLMYDLISEQL